MLCCCICPWLPSFSVSVTQCQIYQVLLGNIFHRMVRDGRHRSRTTSSEKVKSLLICFIYCLLTPGVTKPAFLSDRGRFSDLRGLKLVLSAPTCGTCTLLAHGNRGGAFVRSPILDVVGPTSSCQKIRQDKLIADYVRPLKKCNLAK